MNSIVIKSLTVSQVLWFLWDRETSMTNIKKQEQSFLTKIAYKRMNGRMPAATKLSFIGLRYILRTIDRQETLCLLPLMRARSFPFGYFICHSLFLFSSLRNLLFLQVIFLLLSVWRVTHSCGLGVTCHINSQLLRW